jgi:hypothetical protein
MANGKRDIFMIEGTYTHEAHLLSNTRGECEMAACGECEIPTSRGCCWIATIGSNQKIYGIGKNEREAIQNAMEQIGGNNFTPVLFECIRCTPELYNAIDHKGATGLSWELDEFGIARLVRSINVDINVICVGDRVMDQVARESILGLMAW